MLSLVHWRQQNTDEEIKDLNKTERTTVLWIRELSIKMSILCKFIYRLKAMLIKIPADFLNRNWQADSEMYIEIQRT